MHDMTYLRSNRLLAKIAVPGRGIHAQHRFDYTGFVPEVTLDGKHVFGAPEQFMQPFMPGGNANLIEKGSRPSCSFSEQSQQQAPFTYTASRWNSFGAGFCNGFFWHEPANEAGAGGSFPQIGVGKLTSRDGRSGFDIRGKYDVQPGDFTFDKRGDAEMLFTFNMPAMNGYRVALSKRLWLSGGDMSVETTLTNTGEKPANEIREFNHNFLAIDGLHLGERYSLELPLIAEMPELPEGIAKCGDGIRLTEPRKEPFYFNTENVRPSAGICWTLRHDDVPAACSEIIDFAASDIAVWGIEHVISPEVFITFSLKPGESVSWTRTWRFFSA